MSFGCLVVLISVTVCNGFVLFGSCRNVVLFFWSMHARARADVVGPLSWIAMRMRMLLDSAFLLYVNISPLGCHYPALRHVFVRPLRLVLESLFTLLDVFVVPSLRSYKLGRLTLHDLHEQNLEAMQSVVILGRQLGRPIATSLWSSRADKPNFGTSGEMR